MITHSLNIILKKSLNYKFRRGFIKYLSSLDYEEFESLFVYYANIISTLLIKYSNKKIRFLSRDWFKYKILNIKYDIFFFLFIKGNREFLLEISKSMTQRNEEREKTLNEIDRLQHIINDLYAKEILVNVSFTQQDKIEVITLIYVAIDTAKELEKLLNSLNHDKKN